MRFLIELLAIDGLVFSVLALKVHKTDPSQATPAVKRPAWPPCANKRDFLLVDFNPTAVEIMTSRLAAWI